VRVLFQERFFPCTETTKTTPRRISGPLPAMANRSPGWRFHNLGQKQCVNGSTCDLNSIRDIRS
jgi:hypothetical protein